MSQNQCEHIRPDGARCQAPLQTGRSFCFFHDPEQQENRAAARRNGGFMHDQAYRTPSRTDAPALLPADVPYLYVRTRDDITHRLEEIFNRPLETQQELNRAKSQIYALRVESSNLAAKEREAREAARAAERAAQRAAREAFTKEAIARQVEAAVREALKKDAAAWVEAPGSVGHGFSHDGTRTAGEPRVKASGDEQFHSAEGLRVAQQSAPKEEPIIIDASTPWDLSQFGGKKPRISCVVPVFTSMGRARSSTSTSPARSIRPSTCCGTNSAASRNLPPRPPGSQPRKPPCHRPPLHAASAMHRITQKVYGKA